MRGLFTQQHALYSPSARGDLIVRRIDTLYMIHSVLQQKGKKSDGDVTS